MFIVGTIVVLAGIFYCVIIAASAVWLAAVGLWQAFFEKDESGVAICSAKSKKNAATKSESHPLPITRLHLAGCFFLSVFKFVQRQHVNLIHAPTEPPIQIGSGKQQLPLNFLP